MNAFADRPASFAQLVGYPNTMSKPSGADVEGVHGTTVLALRYDQGILNLGDRRATMANYIMYDRADKIIPLDDCTVMAISGSFARSIEIARYLRHAFKYYARTQLQDLSLEGKLQEVTRALGSNLEFALDGVGMFLPLISAYDPRTDDFGIYLYDVLGARFENDEFGAAGSGSERIRGVFDYVSRVKGPFDKRPLDEVLVEALTMLDIAASLDTATGGLDLVLPVAMTLTKEGVTRISDAQIAKAVKQVTGRS
ncbi:MAG: proteasome subunit alpha [Armatimonadetes bacterium]|nr:MAG: proteasome subunit alpha [Armatimonadota bacterium]